MWRRIKNLWRLSDIDVPKNSKNSFLDKILPKKAEIISLKSRIDEITNETLI